MEATQNIQKVDHIVKAEYDNKNTKGGSQLETAFVPDLTTEGRTLEESFYNVLGAYGPNEAKAQYGFSASLNDDGFHMTANHDISGVRLLRNCREVINTLGRRLSRYKSTKELVQGIYSAIAGTPIN